MKKSVIIIMFVTAFIFAYGTAHSAIVVQSTKGEVAVKEGR